jgi:hypothetical protein
MMYDVCCPRLWGSMLLDPSLRFLFEEVGVESFFNYVMERQF